MLTSADIFQRYIVAFPGHLHCPADWVSLATTQATQAGFEACSRIEKWQQLISKIGRSNTTLCDGRDWETDKRVSTWRAERAQPPAGSPAVGDLLQWIRYVGIHSSGTTTPMPSTCSHGVRCSADTVFAAT